MAEAGLSEPEYIETPNTVRLILWNNIDERMAHRKNQSDESKNGVSNEFLKLPMSESVSKSMSELEKARMQMILNYLDVNKEISSSIAVKPHILHSREKVDFGLPLNLHLPKAVPTAIGDMSHAELDAELAKGMESLKSGKVYTADEVDAELAKEFDI